MSELRIWTDGIDTVIATDEADAAKVWGEHMGASWSDEAGDRSWSPYREGPLSIDLDTDEGRVSLTQAEWITREGRSFLCSTEY